MAAGVLYITGTVAGVLSMVVSAGLRSAHDPLAAAAEHPGTAVTAAVLVLVMGLSLAFVPVVLFPVLRRVNGALAIGYLVLRGALETACYLVLAAGWLLLAPVGEVVAAGPGTTSPVGLRLGDLLLAADAADAVLAVVFSCGGALLYALLYRSRLAPRWIAGWGLAAIALYLVADLLAMYDVVGAGSTTQVLMLMPLAAQEMVLAVWMIARGFRPTAGATASGATIQPADGTLVPA